MHKNNQQKSVRIKTPRDAKGIAYLKILEKTTQSVFNSRIDPKSAGNLRHCHSLMGSRDVVRIDKQEWEERVGKILRLHEKHRYQKKNALQSAIERINALLNDATVREAKLKTTTKELEKTGNYLRILLDSMADIFIATDPGGVITEANIAAQKLSGFNRDELIGKFFVHFISDVTKAQNALNTVLIDGILYDYELELITNNDFKMPIMLNATVLLDVDNEVSGILINARDIRELKKAQQAQKRFAEELARANADLEEFATVASHDLQEPLKKVTEFATQLAETYKDQFDDNAMRDLRFMIRQTDYMTDLVKNVLEYSRVDAGTMVKENTDSQSVFHQAIENLSGAIDESKAIITHDTLPSVQSNSAQLIRVFQNIIGNSIKYRDKEKDKCIIHVSWQRIEKSTVKIPDDAGDIGVLFSIEDNGIGVDPDFQEEVFDMFVRLEDETPGSGLGLAICKKIITRHNGAIWLESEEEKGSTFYFTIPDE